MSYRHLRNPAAYIIRKDYHTRRKQDRYVVVPTERLGDEFQDFRESAEAAGGEYQKKWAGKSGGFAFDTRQEAAEWAAEAFGESGAAEAPPAVRPLYGHTTEATAYKQTVGGKTRAYWLEYKPKKGYRIASRTVAPRMTKPVRSTYTMVGALFLDENGEVGRWVPRDHQPDSYMEFLELFPDLDKRTLARAHDWAMYSQRPGVGVAEKREAWKEVQAKAKSMWENASAAAEPEKKPEKATDTAKMTAEEYTAAISKAIKQRKKILGVKSVSQGYKGTGSRAADRLIAFRSLDGKMVQLSLTGGGWGFTNVYRTDLSNVSQRRGTFTRDLKTDANQIRKALAQWTGVLPPDAPEAPAPAPAPALANLEPAADTLWYHCGARAPGQDFSLGFLRTGEGYTGMGDGVYFATKQAVAEVYCKYAKDNRPYLTTARIKGRLTPQDEWDNPQRGDVGKVMAIRTGPYESFFEAVVFDPENIEIVGTVWKGEGEAPAPAPAPALPGGFDSFEDPTGSFTSSADPLDTYLREIAAEMGAEGRSVAPNTVLRGDGLSVPRSGVALYEKMQGNTVLDRAWMIQVDAANEGTAIRLGERAQKNLIPRTKVASTAPLLHHIPLYVIYNNGWVKLAGIPEEKKQKKRTPTQKIIARGDDFFGAGATSIKGRGTNRRLDILLTKPEHLKGRDGKNLIMLMGRRTLPELEEGLRETIAKFRAEAREADRALWPEHKMRRVFMARADRPSALTADLLVKLMESKGDRGKRLAFDYLNVLMDAGLVDRSVGSEVWSRVSVAPAPAPAPATHKVAAPSSETSGHYFVNTLFRAGDFAINEDAINGRFTVTHLPSGLRVEQLRDRKEAESLTRHMSANADGISSVFGSYPDTEGMVRLKDAANSWPGRAKSAEKRVRKPVEFVDVYKTYKAAKKAIFDYFVSQGWKGSSFSLKVPHVTKGEHRFRFKPQAIYHTTKTGKSWSHDGHSVDHNLDTRKQPAKELYESLMRQYGIDAPAAADVKAPVVPSPTPAPPADTTRTTQVVLGVKVGKMLPHFEVYATLTPTTTGGSASIKMARFSYTDKADADATQSAAERYAKDLENRQMIALLGGAPAQLEGWISTFCNAGSKILVGPDKGSVLACSEANIETIKGWAQNTVKDAAGRTLTAAQAHALYKEGGDIASWLRGQETAPAAPAPERFLQIAEKLAEDPDLKGIVEPLRREKILRVGDRNQAVIGIGKGFPNQYGYLSAPYRGQLALTSGPEGSDFRVMDGGQQHKSGSLQLDDNLDALLKKLKAAILSIPKLGKLTHAEIHAPAPAAPAAPAPAPAAISAVYPKHPTLPSSTRSTFRKAARRPGELTADIAVNLLNSLSTDGQKSRYYSYLLYLIREGLVPPSVGRAVWDQVRVGNEQSGQRQQYVADLLKGLASDNLSSSKSQAAIKTLYGMMYGSLDDRGLALSGATAFVESDPRKARKLLKKIPSTLSGGDKWLRDLVLSPLEDIDGKTRWMRPSRLRRADGEDKKITVYTDVVSLEQKQSSGGSQGPVPAGLRGKVKSTTTSGSGQSRAKTAIGVKNALSVEFEPLGVPRRLLYPIPAASAAEAPYPFEVGDLIETKDKSKRGAKQIFRVTEQGVFDNGRRYFKAGPVYPTLFPAIWENIPNYGSMRIDEDGSLDGDWDDYKLWTPSEDQKNVTKASKVLRELREAGVESITLKALKRDYGVDTSSNVTNTLALLYPTAYEKLDGSSMRTIFTTPEREALRIIWSEHPYLEAPVAVQRVTPEMATYVDSGSTYLKQGTPLAFAPVGHQGEDTKTEFFPEDFRYAVVDWATPGSIKLKATLLGGSNQSSDAKKRAATARYLPKSTGYRKEGTAKKEDEKGLHLYVQTSTLQALTAPTPAPVKPARPKSKPVQAAEALGRAIVWYVTEHTPKRAPRGVLTIGSFKRAWQQFKTPGSRIRDPKPLDGVSQADLDAMRTMADTSGGPGISATYPGVKIPVKLRNEMIDAIRAQGLTVNVALDDNGRYEAMEIINPYSPYALLEAVRVRLSEHPNADVLVPRLLDMTEGRTYREEAERLLAPETSNPRYTRRW